MVSPLLSPASLVRLFKAGSFDESLVGFLMLLGNIAGQILFLPIATGSLLLKGLTDVSGQSTRLKDPKVILITGARYLPRSRSGFGDACPQRMTFG